MLAEFIFKVIAAGAGLLVSISITYAVTRIFNIYHSTRKFKKATKGIPFIEGESIFGRMIELSNKDENWKYIHDIHSKYGKNYAMMFGSQTVFGTTDLDLIKRIAIDEADIHTCRAHDLGIPVNELEFDEILLVYGDQWRRIRNCIAPAFTNHKMKAPNVREEMLSTVDKFMESIEKKLKNNNDSIVIDIEDHFHRFIVSLVFTCLYKQNNEIDFDAEQDDWRELLEAGPKAIMHPLLRAAFAFPILRPLIRFYLMKFDPFGIMRNKILKFIAIQTQMFFEARKKADAENKIIDDTTTISLDSGVKFRRNMIDFMINKYYEGQLTTREYFHSSVALFFAAHKTTADGINKLLYFIANDTRVQEKLRKSILEDGVESEYLSWCVFEALRLHPPVHFGATRTTACDISLENGSVIPKDTIVFCSAYTVNRLKSYWGPDADEFRPERWAKSKEFHPAQYTAFGLGKRSCLGKDFALHSIKLTIDRLLRNYKLEYVNGPNDEMTFSAPLWIICHFHGPTYVRFNRL